MFLQLNRYEPLFDDSLTELGNEEALPVGVYPSEVVHQSTERPSEVLLHPRPNPRSNLRACRSTDASLVQQEHDIFARFEFWSKDLRKAIEVLNDWRSSRHEIPNEVVRVTRRYCVMEAHKIREDIVLCCHHETGVLQAWIDSIREMGRVVAVADVV